jgi:hypothetical protein
MAMASRTASLWRGSRDGVVTFADMDAGIGRGFVTGRDAPAVGKIV